MFNGLAGEKLSGSPSMSGENIASDIKIRSIRIRPRASLIV